MLACMAGILPKEPSPQNAVFQKGGLGKKAQMYTQTMKKLSWGKKNCQRIGDLVQLVASAQHTQGPRFNPQHPPKSLLSFIIHDLYLQRTFILYLTGKTKVHIKN